MTEPQRDKNNWPSLRKGEATREKRVRRRKERHRQNQAVSKELDFLPKIPMPCLD